MSNAKGDRRERELVKRLDEAGFAVMRAPASGSATSRELPDVLAGNGAAFYAIEVKSSAGDPIYLGDEEVEALTYFAQNFGAKPRVGVRFDREDWAFFHPGSLYSTDAGSWRIKKEEAVNLEADNGEETTSGESIDDLWVDPDAGSSTERVRQVLQAFDGGHVSFDEAVKELS